MRKIVIIGLGYVGKNYCFSLINQNIVDEIALIDEDKDKLMGNYIDLLDAVSFSNAKIKIGDYSDCNNADLIVITAGKNQKVGESRLDLINSNNLIMKSICDNIKKTNFNGFILVATNPLDVCTYLVKKYTNYENSKIIGSGTLLDTIRLKRILSEKLNVDIKNISASVVGEHGDSSVILWSKIHVNNEKVSFSEEEKENITKELHNVAYNIINLKGETSFGIARVLSYMTKCVFSDKEEEIIASILHDDYSISYFCTLNNKGLKLINNFDITEEEKEKYEYSIKVIRESLNSLEVL